MKALKLVSELFSSKAKGKLQMSKTNESTQTSAASAGSHINKVKPRPDFVVLGPGNGCRPAGTT